MSQIKVDTITDELGTGAPNFPYGAEGIGGGFTYAAVTGATHDLDYANGNFFDAGTLTANTTVTFSNLETQSNWRYKFTTEVISGEWDISKSVYSGVSASAQTEETVVEDLFFKPDGTKVYVVGSTGDEVNEYDLSTAWDLRTLSFVQNFSVSSQETSPKGLFFKTDGTKMYVVGSSGDDVNEYNLSTAWDISTASYSTASSLALGGVSVTAPEGLFFKSDGTKMYICCSATEQVVEYTLSTAWSVSTISYSSDFSVSGPTGSTVLVVFKPDGTRMYTGDGSNDTIAQFDLSTAWDLSTASLASGTFRTIDQESSLHGIQFHPDGDRMFAVGTTEDTIFEYYVGDTGALTFPSSVSNTSKLSDTFAAKSYTYEFLTTDGGTTVDIISEEIF